MPSPAAPAASRINHGNPATATGGAELGRIHGAQPCCTILKAEKKQYDENVARSREVAQLATQLVETYEAKEGFGADDGKKLERLENSLRELNDVYGQTASLM